MSVKVLKIVTGEEIIGEVVSDDTNVICLKNIVAIVLQPTRDGKLSFGFIPWGSMIDGSITLKYSDLVYSGNPTEDLLNNYNSMFSGIVTPPKNLIV
jgi:hypothetical protein